MSEESPSVNLPKLVKDEDPSKSPERQRRRRSYRKGKEEKEEKVPRTDKSLDSSEKTSDKKKAQKKRKNNGNETEEKTQSSENSSKNESQESKSEGDSKKTGSQSSRNNTAKRRERRAKKKAAEEARQTLSEEGMALLRDIKARSKKQQRADGLKTGKISMSDLMGNGDSCPDLQRLRLCSNLNPEGFLQSTITHMPQVPGFPSLIHRPDSGPFSSAFRPELFKTTMEAYASAVALHCSDEGGFGGKRSMGTNRFTPDQLLPWVTLAPMFPVNEKLDGQPGGAQKPGTMGGFKTPTGSSSRPNTHSTYNRNGSGVGARSSMSNTSNGQGGNQKTRKPFFMPYLSTEAVSRGLANGELVKGSLRVNQRNYEESFIDNPEGDDQLDLLILGVHDRNRALHGDIVVVRVKGREDWVVRENLYHAWRLGTLKVSKDENGQPLTIPPIAPPDRPPYIDMLNGMMSRGDVSTREMAAPVSVPSSHIYDKKAMVLIALQSQSNDLIPASSIHPVDIEPSTHELIANLSITKNNEMSNSPAVAIQKTPVSAKRSRPQNNSSRRSSHKLLSDMPDEDWGMPDMCLQKTAEVVYITEQKNCRAAMGQLKVMADGNHNWALFSPTDSRMPRMLIPYEQLPIGFFERPHDYARFIFVARMDEWQATAQFARGKLERTLGESGDIDAETEGLLFANDVDTREFSHAALSSLPITEATQWSIDEKEFKYRKDLREQIIFTIDPKTARDLDDALSIDKCEDIDGKGTPGWEVGVHIADVAHFVLEGTELDKWAAQRATSVYLVHKVIPMLPRILCEELCSLNAGVDRLTFSVVWKMDNDGNIHDSWFGRTVIRSCVKLSYEHAQDFIDHPEKDFPESELPPIHDKRKPADIKQKVLLLHKIALKLRKGREDNGSLRLDQPKLKFALDEDTKLPYGVTVYERKDSNSLVEEFMLLANISVAKRVEKEYPKIALLRRHPPPKQKVMREMLELCEKIGYPLDANSSGLLSSSLRKFEGNKGVQTAINQVLSMFMMKPMQLAQYFCTGSVSSTAEYHHYALNVPYYTHFTSPIRRYPDVLVHRLLAGALGYAPPPTLTPAEVEAHAQHCNDKKAAAKAVSEMSDETFFGLFVKQCGPLVEKAVVVNVLDASFDVLVLKYGVIKRVYVNRLDMARDPLFEGSPPSLTLYWNPGSGKPNSPIEQTIQICSVVDVILSALPEPTKYQAVVKMCPKSESKTLHDLLDLPI